MGKWHLVNIKHTLHVKDLSQSILSSISVWRLPLLCPTGFWTATSSSWRWVWSAPPCSCRPRRTCRRTPRPSRGSWSRSRWRHTAPGPPPRSPPPAAPATSALQWSSRAKLCASHRHRVHGPKRRTRPSRSHTQQPEPSLDQTHHRHNHQERIKSRDYIRHLKLVWNLWNGMNGKFCNSMISYQYSEKLHYPRLTLYFNTARLVVITYVKMLSIKFWLHRLSSLIEKKIFSGYSSKRGREGTFSLWFWGTFFEDM